MHLSVIEDAVSSESASVFCGSWRLIVFLPCSFMNRVWSATRLFQVDRIGVYLVLVGCLIRFSLGFINLSRLWSSDSRGLERESVTKGFVFLSRLWSRDSHGLERESVIKGFVFLSRLGAVTVTARSVRT